MCDGFTRDTSLTGENKTLKKEANELIHVLIKAYSGEAHLLKCLGSQRFYLNKEILVCSTKNGKVAFAIVGGLLLPRILKTLSNYSVLLQMY